MLRRLLCFFLLLVSAIPGVAARREVSLSVSLTPSVPSPAPLGTIVTWTAAVTGIDSGSTLWYRFRARQWGSDYHIIRDFGPLNSLNWTASEHEGVYEIELTVRVPNTRAIAMTAVTYQMTPRISGTDPLVSPTPHPLVVLYSAPPCDSGSRMRVLYQAANGAVQNTPFKPCAPGLSMNFYVAGLLANTSYTAWHSIDTGSQFIAGPNVTFKTKDSGPKPFNMTVIKAPSASAPNPVLLASSFIQPAATDLNGNLLWYCGNQISFVTQPEGGGRFWGILENGTITDPSLQTIREFDLLGLTLRETNAARVNEQLKAMGRRQISAFHHDVKRLPDGRIAALGAVEQILRDVQGPGPVDIIGDMVIVFDSQLNVIWTWDTFDHLDVTRAAVLGETCVKGNGACPPYYLSPNANDWTHGNSVSQTPDGNLLYSSRHQDWLVKFNYDNGNGDGSVIWKLGKDGDFQIISNDPYPWFSHQHDAKVLFSSPTTLLVFDNGNTRIGVDKGGNSRGQVFSLNETNRTASFILNAGLGVNSLALGTAEQLPDGSFNFDAGYVADTSSPTGTSAYSIVADTSGNIVYESKSDQILYRWFRLADLYSPD